ncbi:hypothetical protein DPMN_144911 [Dreissena polymorpha]|uniref:Uncharacterized protein n=1 Tax=Dreissena polymorpha TaxID=45954 RepID=A0A9D4F301_DREPO|nr:hypothetical protein DPMN_144911 [Dreissena polymorpha]
MLPSFRIFTDLHGSCECNPPLRIFLVNREPTRIHTATTRFTLRIIPDKIQHLYGAQSPSPQYKHGCIWQCRTVPDRSETIRGLLECVSVDGLPKTIPSVTTRRPLRNRSIFMNDLEESFETPINSP